MVIHTFIFYTLKSNTKLKYKFPKIHKKLKRNDFPEVDRGIVLVPIWTKKEIKSEHTSWA